MFILSNLIEAFAYVIDTLLTIYIFIIAARAILSWVNPDPYNPIVRFLHQTTEPVLSPLRRLIPGMRYSGLDISPIIAFVLMIFARQFVVRSLYQFAGLLR
ncbi:MAG: YggT family protein [Deltaproteobacteria bacterium]|nr:YggT family protein [Deltaproteobacteria bacterium]